MALHLKKLESLSSKNACAKIDWNWLSGSGEEEFNFVNVFSLFRNYLPLENGGALYLDNLISPSPKDALCQVWLKLAQWFWRRRFFNFVNVFFPTISYICNYLALEKGGALHLNTLYPRMLCAKFGWNWLSGSGEEEFFNFVDVFSLFRNYLPLEKGGGLYLDNLISPSPKDALCQDWLKLAQWFWRRRFFNFVNFFFVISYICNYLPLEKSGALHLNKLESPLPKDALCQVWLKLVKWFWRRRFLNFVNVFSLFRYYLPLEKGGALHLNKLESPLPKDALFQVWLKLAQWFWRRRWKCEKFTDGQTDRQTTDDNWSDKVTWAFSSGELKNTYTAKNYDVAMVMGVPLAMRIFLPNQP